MAVCVAAANASMTIMNAAAISGPPATAITTQGAALNLTMQPMAEKMCAWAAPTYNGSSSTVDRKLWVAAQVVLTTALIGLNTHIQNKQYEIAKEYQNLSTQKWERFRDKYAPLERKMLNETSSVADPKPDYADASTRANTAADIAFGIMASDLKRYAKMYALCIDDSLNTDRYKALARDDTTNFNYRDAENWAMYKSDQRWNRRSDILNLGRDNSATGFSYASSASTAFSGYAAALSQAGNGLSGLFGYLANRNETSIPNQFAQSAQFGNGIIASGAAGGSPTVN